MAEAKLDSPTPILTLLIPDFKKSCPTEPSATLTSIIAMGDDAKLVNIASAYYQWMAQKILIRDIHIGYIWYNC